MPNQKQLAKIHIAKKEIFQKDEHYRNTLSGWTNIKTGLPVEHSNELTDDQAEELLSVFKKLGWKPKRSSRSNVQSSKSDSGQAGMTRPHFEIKLPEGRADEYATQPQMNMLCGLWVDKSREKTEESFRKFVRNIVHYDLIDSLQKKDVQKIRIAIVKLKQAKAEEK